MKTSKHPRPRPTQFVPTFTTANVTQRHMLSNDSALDLAWLRVLDTLPPSRQSALDAHEAVDGVARPSPHCAELGVPFSELPMCL